jgi:hypothetical protein
MFAVLFPSALLDYLLSSRIYYQLVEGNGIKGYPWVAAFYKGEKVRARFLKYMYICIYIYLMGAEGGSFGTLDQQIRMLKKNTRTHTVRKSDEKLPFGGGGGCFLFAYFA